MSAEQNEAMVCRITETQMRALIFELRPMSLEAEELVAAPEKQTAVLKARHGIEVEATLCEEPEASLKAKEATYRIAQEVLHNTVKHASAGKVGIKMQCRSGSITLKILDDGVGFDPTEDLAGHLGLRSIPERAARLGGTLEVQGDPGHGTRVLASTPPAARLGMQMWDERNRGWTTLYRKHRGASDTPLIPLGTQFGAMQGNEKKTVYL